jgi:hypothetical protein
MFQCETGRFPLSVSNTYGYTKLYINDNIPEINLFKARLVVVIFVFLLVTLNIQFFH